MKKSASKLRKLLFTEAGIRSQIEWFGGGQFMILIFAAFVIAFTILIIQHQ